MEAGAGGGLIWAWEFQSLEDGLSGQLKPDIWVAEGAKWVS